MNTQLMMLFLFSLNMILGIIVGFNISNAIKAIQEEQKDERH